MSNATVEQDRSTPKGAIAIPVGDYIAFVDERPVLASVTDMHSRTTRRSPRVAPVPVDVHARLIAVSNRLLATAATTEMAASDAFGGVIGALINALPPGGRSLSKQGLVDLLERTADGLGCPPAVAPARKTRGAR